MTSSFALTLPDGWIQNLASKPVSARGPRGELLQISSSAITGQPTPEESARVLRQIEEVAVGSMRRAAADPALVTVTPLKKTVLPSGATLHEMVSKSRDGRSRAPGLGLLIGRCGPGVGGRAPVGPVGA